MLVQPHGRSPHGRAVVAPDKFRGTATAAEVASAVAVALIALGMAVDELAMADGGEGTLDALGGANRESTVTGPLGQPVVAGWRLDGRTAVIEMAQAAGLLLAGGAEGNDPVAATTAGVGELIAMAVERGARRVIVTLGGSATTDGGYGALQVLQPTVRLKGIDLVVATDVRTRFLDAATIFGPQKGATKAQIKLLTGRLARLAQMYESTYGVDVAMLDGSGAAGGLAGGLAAIGAKIRPGFDLVAEEVGLDDVLEHASLVVTGEGYLDEQSLDGKVVGGVIERAGALGVPVLVVCGEADDQVATELRKRPSVTVVSLVERFGVERAFDDTISCITEAVEGERASFSGDEPRG